MESCREGGIKRKRRRSTIFKRNKREQLPRDNLRVTVERELGVGGQGHLVGALGVGGEIEMALTDNRCSSARLARQIVQRNHHSMAVQ